MEITSLCEKKQPCYVEIATLGIYNRLWWSILILKIPSENRSHKTTMQAAPHFLWGSIPPLLVTRWQGAGGLIGKQCTQQTAPALPHLSFSISSKSGADLSSKLALTTLGQTWCSQGCPGYRIVNSLVSRPQNIERFELSCYWICDERSQFL